MSCNDSGLDPTSLGNDGDWCGATLISSDPHWVQPVFSTWNSDPSPAPQLHLCFLCIDTLQTLLPVLFLESQGDSCASQVNFQICPVPNAICPCSKIIHCCLGASLIVLRGKGQQFGGCEGAAGLTLVRVGIIGYLLGRSLPSGKEATVASLGYRHCCPDNLKHCFALATRWGAVVTILHF